MRDCLRIYVFWPLWSNGQSSWQQIQRSWFNSWSYQIFWEVVGLEWGPFILMSTNEELLGRKYIHSSLEVREYGSRDPLCSPLDTLYPQKLALTSQTSSGCSACIVLSQTKALELLTCSTSSGMVLPKRIYGINKLWYTGCPRRNVPDFGRVFLMVKYTDITQNTYVQS
jgi:hypothetical protein